MHILILDDQPGVAQLLALSLAERNISAIAFTDPEEALKALTGVDTLLLDYNMPRMNGLEFARQAHARGWRGSLFLMSGQTKNFPQAAVSFPPVRSCLKKPFEINFLLGILENLPSISSED